MKKFLKQLGLYAFIPLIMLLAIGLMDNLDKKTSTNENIIKIQNISRFDSLDFLFVGNSYCYSGIKNPMFDSLDLKTFNLGIATAGPLFYNLLLNDYLSSVKKYPKYIFLLVSQNIFSNGSDNFTAYPIHRYLSRPISNIALATSQWQNLSLFPELIQKSFKKGVINLYKIRDGIPVESINTILDSKGFVSSNTIVNDSIVAETERLYLPFKQDTFSKSKYFKLIELIDTIKKKGIKIILFDLPTNKLSNYYNDGFNKTYNEKIDDLKKKYNFISLSRINLGDSSYRNLDHLNDFGAQIVTDSLLKHITQSNYLNRTF